MKLPHSRKSKIVGGRAVSEQPERLYLRIAEFVGQSYRDSDHKNPETWIRIRRGSQAWECRASATPVVETPFREVVKP